MPTLPSLSFIGGLGMPELILLAVLALLLFGSRLPETGRSIGRGISEFKKGLLGQDQSPPPAR